MRADLPTIVVAAASFDDMVAITGCVMLTGCNLLYALQQCVNTCKASTCCMRRSRVCVFLNCRYTIFINIAVQGSSNKAWHIAQGPLSVVFGFMLGAVAALACSATRLWNNKYKRVLALVIAGGLA